MGLVVGINASRNRSGGARVHLRGILNSGDPRSHGISALHLWSYKALLDKLPDSPYLIKHNPPALERSLVHQAWWEYKTLAKEALNYDCDILLNTDAGSVCGFRPAVTMSRDMLSYEWQEMRRYGLSAMLFRLILLRYIQRRSLKRADGAVFLTQYAANVIQRVTGALPRSAVIPHGVGSEFNQATSAVASFDEPGKEIRCLYVSNAEVYKHQWVVVRAVGELRRRGHNVSLLLAGGGSGRAQRLLDTAIADVDPGKEFVETMGFVSHEEIPGLLANADIFIFASSCENMPNTLVEAMSSGLPIACSDRGPMPEVLKDGGVYFNPESSESIAAAVENIIVDNKMRLSIGERAKKFAEQYSWARCAGETWEFLKQICEGKQDRV
ncbi:glycosyltransferase family 4 protein [Thermodesulfobacteriota bacterium]